MHFMRQTSLVLALTLFGASAFAADPQLMNLLMPDAKIVAGINVSTAKISPLGQFLISRVPGNGPGLQRFIATTGFDPRQNLTEVLAATNADASSPASLLILSGTFDVSWITTAVANHPNQQVGTYDGATLITATAPNARVVHAIAFMGNSIAVAGTASSVEAALDRSSQQNSIDSGLATQVNTLSLNNDEWLASITSVGALLPAKLQNATGPQAQLVQTFKSVQQFSGGIKLGGNDQASATLLTDTSQNAAAVANAFRLLIALASMNSTKSSKAALLSQMAGNLHISGTGQEVDLTLTIPETQVESLITALQPRSKSRAIQRHPVR